ncbi:hypothetical protein B0H10DRAFT_1208447 [Mycena sp. CBHHK59/15]|nr:hypothetical protein B0H10DRAFT_1208447 [Mycena sp. CBHHK59/15]
MHHGVPSYPRFNYQYQTAVLCGCYTRDAACPSSSQIHRCMPLFLGGSAPKQLVFPHGSAADLLRTLKTTRRPDSPTSLSMGLMGVAYIDASARTALQDLLAHLHNLTDLILSPSAGWYADALSEPTLCARPVQILLVPKAREWFAFRWRLDCERHGTMLSPSRRRSSPRCPACSACLSRGAPANSQGRKVNPTLVDRFDGRKLVWMMLTFSSFFPPSLFVVVSPYPCHLRPSGSQASDSQAFAKIPWGCPEHLRPPILNIRSHRSSLH